MSIWLLDSWTPSRWPQCKCWWRQPIISYCVRMRHRRGQLQVAERWRQIKTVSAASQPCHDAIAHSPAANSASSPLLTTPVMAHSCGQVSSGQVKCHPPITGRWLEERGFFFAFVFASSWRVNFMWPYVYNSACLFCKLHPPPSWFSVLLRPAAAPANVFIRKIK